MKKPLKYAFVAAVLALASSAFANQADCVKVSNVVKQAVEASPADVLEIVARQVAANQACACEVVKAAIMSSAADKDLVASIVDAAILEAPEMRNIVAQCAIAIAPDAISDVQKVMAKYDQAQGEGGYSAKGGGKGGLPKGGLAQQGDPGRSLEPWNPLDFPHGGNPNNPVGLTPGGPGGYPLIPIGVPPFYPGLTPSSPIGDGPTKD